MALDINIDIPQLKLNEQHTSTTIEVSEVSDFTTHIIDETLTLPDSLTFKTFDVEFTPRRLYYVRVRAILTPGGAQGISDTVTFVAEDSNDITLHLNPPASINPPTLTLNGGVVDTDHTQLFFSQVLDLNVPHSIESTSWILTDSQNIVRFSSMSDTTNLSDIVVDALLKQNELFIMRCMVRLDTGATSMFSSLPFTTGDYPGGLIRFDPAYEDLTRPLAEAITEAHLLPIAKCLSKDIKVYSGATIIKEVNITGDVIPLSPEVNTYQEYVIKVSANMSNGQYITPVYQHVYIPEFASSYPKTLPVEPE